MNKKLTSVLLKDVKTGEVREQAFGGVFIYVGLDPVSEFATELGILDENGWVITDDHMRTTVPGIFAVGDVRQKDLRQVTTAVGDGAIAGQEVYKYINRKLLIQKNLSFLSQIFFMLSFQYSIGLKYAIMVLILW